MRSLAIALFALTATPLVAQNAAPAPVPASAPKFSLDTPIETIAADPAAKAVLEANMPGMTTHAMYDSFKSMSLTQVAPMSGGRITEDALAKVKAALAEIK